MPAERRGDDRRSDKPPATAVVSEDQVAALAGLVPSLIAAAKAGAGQVPEPLRRTLGTLGPRHVNVLIWLSSIGPVSVSELSSRLGVTLATASLMVNELDRAGLVERREDARDHRRKIVHISELHRSEVERFLQARRRPLRRTLEQLAPAERAGFIAALGVLVGELSAPD